MSSHLVDLRRRSVLAGLLAMGGLAVGGSLVQAAVDPAPGSTEPGAGTSYGPAVWMRIPRIDVDTATVDVGISDGYYDVPWFDVGHHVDSANPGEPDNCIFNGHVLTINAGRVFYRLKELEPGDAVFVYTAAYRTGWAIVSTGVVADGDDTFLAPTGQPRVTLYTCTGSFNLLERYYADRLVVTAELVEVVART